MKPALLKAVLTTDIGNIPKNNLVAFNEKGTQLLFIDGQLNYDNLKILIDNNDGIISHIVNKSLHWSPADRRDYADYKEKLDIHLIDNVIHVTQMDKNSWNSKETEEGAQLKANAVMELLNIHENDLDVHVTKREKDRWNNTYTREQIASLLNSAKTDTTWKDAVETYEDLYTTYPNAQKGWICTVLKNNVTYIFTAVVDDSVDPPVTVNRWITAFSNSIPLATENNSGQLSAALYIKLSNIEENANYYVHPDNVNMRHVTDAEKKIWSNKASKDLATIFTAGLMSSYDKDKIDTVEKYANYYMHPDRHEPEIIAQDATHRFVTDAQITLWNDKPTGLLASDENDGQMSKADYIKLFNIEPLANHYVHPAKHSSTDIAQDTTHRFVTDAQISIWNNKEDTNQSQYRADKALEYSKEYTDLKISQIVGLAPNVLDTFEELSKALGNDPDFAANIATELSNKVSILSYNAHIADYSAHLSLMDRAKFNTVETYANHYIHPDYHPAEMISSDPNHRFISDVERTEWNSKANGNIATELIAGQMSPAMVKKLNSITTTGEIMSDWNETNEDSGSFIRNKPTALPANGGNADTVNSYTATQLVNSRKSSTIVIGCTSSGFTAKDVDFLCTGTTDSAVIANAFAAINEVGGSIVFREGVYLINAPLALNKSKVSIKGSAAVVLKATFSSANPILYITGDNCSVEGISFNGNTSVTGDNLRITGNYNVVRDCSFTIGNGTVISTGSFNKIINNSFNTGVTAIYSKILNEASFGNVISNNSVIGYTLGINIESTSNKTNGNNAITSNIIYNCYSGIKLTNALQAHNSVNNAITGNTVMRGTGLSSDYLYEQHTIRIEKGAFNIVSGNNVKGRAVVDEGQNNVVANNVSV